MVFCILSWKKDMFKKTAGYGFFMLAMLIWIRWGIMFILNWNSPRILAVNSIRIQIKHWKRGNALALQ